MEIWPVDGPWPGQLAVCSRPRAGWFLDDDLRELRAAGYRVLVSALTPEEVIRSELERVPTACEDIGLEFAHFPTGNLQVAPPERAHPYLVDWHRRLEAGDGVAVHCWASVGRGPTIASALMVLGGVELPEAWRRIQDARGREVPDTHQQRLWALNFNGMHAHE
ncbi:MAG: tyrosine protein phosphatase [Dehalococcoidia bacterium]